MKTQEKPQGVLIVGAGPTGLFSAITLARMGVPVTVIEQRTELTSGSKALSLSPLSAQLLDEADALGPFLESCHRTKAFNIHFGSQRLTRINFSRLGAKYPFFLMQPQPATERMLEDKLKQWGVRVYRGVSLVGLNQHETGVQALLSSPIRNQLELNFSYVIGCDGARSSVRNFLGASFTGYDYSGMHFILADCEVEWSGALAEAHYFVNQDGFMVLAPLNARLHRVVIQVKEPFVPGKTPEFEQFEKLAEKIAPKGLSLRNPAWISSAPFYNRLISNNAFSRVFLAGDASHLFSPLGGMGMNTGLGDAYNISWKIGYVMQSWAPATLLQTYEKERLGIASQLVRQTDLSTSLAARLERHSSADEEKFLPRLSNRDTIRGQLPLQASGYGQAYPSELTGRIGNGSLVGRLAPFVGTLNGMKGKDTLSLLKGLKHVLFLGATLPHEISKAKVLARELVAEFGHFLTPYVVCEEVPPHERANPLFVEDSQGELSARYGLGLQPIVLIRPDAYVEFQAETEDAWALRAHLKEYYSSQRIQELSHAYAH